MSNSLKNHIENKRPQAWTWGKKDTHEWVSSFRALIAGQDRDYSDKILSAMIKDTDFINHAALRFEYWSTVICAQRRDFFTEFLKELSQRPYRSNVLIAEIMLYTVNNKIDNLAVEFIQSNCVNPIQLQEFQMVAYTIEHSSAHTGADAFLAVWRKGKASVQGVKSLNPAIIALIRKKVGDWNPEIVDALLPKINTASLRKYCMRQPPYITDRLEHLIGLHEQMILNKKLLQQTNKHFVLPPQRKI